MKVLLVALLLCLLAIPAAVFSSEQEQASPGSSVTDLPLIATFEDGQRYEAGLYPVIVLTGSYREMGRQYGGLMKTELTEEYAFLMNTITSQGMTKGVLLQPCILSRPMAEF